MRFCFNVLYSPQLDGEFIGFVAGLGISREDDKPRWRELDRQLRRGWEAVPAWVLAAPAR